MAKTLVNDLKQLLRSDHSDEHQSKKEKFLSFLRSLEESNNVMAVRNLVHQLQHLFEKEEKDGRQVSCLEDLLIRKFPFLEKWILHSPNETPKEDHHIMGKKMIGFEKEFDKIKKRLFGHVKEREVIAIVGMGGSGKTTLAKKLYQNLALKSHFEVVVWVDVSHKYDKREIMLHMLQSMGILTPEIQGESERRLNEELYRYLRTRKHLIVMDDMWSQDAFDDVKNMLPDDTQNNSRIVVTTRLLEVAEYAVRGKGCVHQMRLLTIDESWELLCTITFQEDAAAACPDFLVEVAKKIASNCKGLPLAIEVISGYLRIKPREKKIWEEFASKTDKFLGADDSTRKMIRLSLDDLSHDLKPCFLYFGLLAKDEKITFSQLVKIYTAEGFLMSNSTSPEEDTLKYLKELDSRNLVIAEYNPCGRMVRCSIHGVLRDLCLEIAKEEHFAAAIHKNSDDVKQPQRLAIHVDLGENRPPKSIIEPGNLSHLRSFICKKRLKFIEKKSSSHLHCFSKLEVAELPTMDFFGHSIDMLKLSNLKYLSLSVTKWRIPQHFADHFPEIQSLIMSQAKVEGTRVLWKMPKLRHLCFASSDMKCPKDTELKLPNLETLVYIKAYNCSQELFAATPNLRKLGVIDTFSDNLKPFSCIRIYDTDLPKLEILRFKHSGHGTFRAPSNWTLPENLKRVTLSHTKLPWKSLSIIGKLPNLEELKLSEKACTGETWETNEGEFQQLKLLSVHAAGLRCWETSAGHFPQLVHLTLQKCISLEKLPQGLVEF